MANQLEQLHLNPSDLPSDLYSTEEEDGSEEEEVPLYPVGTYIRQECIKREL